MNGWYLVSCGAVCALGALMFLWFAAMGIEASERAMGLLEERERKAFQKRQVSGSMVTTAEAAA
jgi:hypothetical protein